MEEEKKIFYDETYHLLATRKVEIVSVLELVQIKSIEPDTILNVDKVSDQMALLHVQDIPTVKKIQSFTDIQDVQFIYPNVCRGVIKNIPLELTIKEIYKKLTAKVKILNMERMTRWEEQKTVPSKNIQITFQGHILPRTIEFMLTDKTVHYFKPKPYMKLDYMTVLDKTGYVFRHNFKYSKSVC